VTLNASLGTRRNLFRVCRVDGSACGRLEDVCLLCALYEITLCIQPADVYIALLALYFAAWRAFGVSFSADTLHTYLSSPSTASVMLGSLNRHYAARPGWC